MENVKQYVKNRFGVGDNWVTAGSMVDFLVKDWRDYLFLENEFSKGHSMMEALVALREKQIRETNLSKEEFLLLFKENPIYALSILFQYRINPMYVDVMNEKGISPEEVYDRWKKNPLSPIGRIVL